MEKSTAFSNALSVFSYLASFYPTCSICFYKAEKGIEVAIHVKREIYNVEDIQNKMGDVAIDGTEIKMYDVDFDEYIIISAQYSIDDDKPDYIQHFDPS